MFPALLHRKFRPYLDRFIPSLRPSIQVKVNLLDLDSVGQGWFSYLRSMPPSIVLLKDCPRTIGPLYTGPLLLQFELPDDIDPQNYDEGEYGPILFLLLHLRQSISDVGITLSKATLTNCVRVRMNTNHEETLFDEDLPAQSVDGDDAPHTILR